MFFFSSRRRHTICALVTVVQTCALPISRRALDPLGCRPGSRAGAEVRQLRLRGLLHQGPGDAVLSEEIRLREDICRHGRSLFERGLTFGSSGNISARLPNGGWLMTPTNVRLGELDPARLARLDDRRSEEHTSELQSLMRTSYA